MSNQTGFDIPYLQQDYEVLLEVVRASTHHYKEQVIYDIENKIEVLKLNGKWQDENETQLRQDPS